MCVCVWVIFSFSFGEAQNLVAFLLWPLQLHLHWLIFQVVVEVIGGFFFSLGIPKVAHVSTFFHEWSVTVSFALWSHFYQWKLHKMNRISIIIIIIKRTACALAKRLASLWPLPHDFSLILSVFLLGVFVFTWSFRHFEIFCRWFQSFELTVPRIRLLWNVIRTQTIDSTVQKHK